MLSTVVMTAIIVMASPKLSDNEFVFTRYHNETGFNGESGWNLSYICLMGVLMSLYGLSGYESGATLSEETTDASVTAPKGMIEAVVASCITGFIFIIGLLYACQNDIN
jgi:amino acid transporter